MFDVRSEATNPLQTRIPSPPRKPAQVPVLKLLCVSTGRHRRVAGDAMDPRKHFLSGDRWNLVNVGECRGCGGWRNMVKHGETWWLWVWKWLIIHPSHFEYSIDLDRFGGTLFSGKPANPTRFVGWNPTAPRYKGTVPLFSFHFFPHTMWILTHGEYYSQGKFNMFLLLYKWDGNSYNYQGIYHKFELLRVHGSNNSTLSYLLHKILEV